MSSRPRRIPKYRHYKPKNLAVVRIDGKDEYLGQYGSPESWERYHRRIGEWLASLAGGQTPLQPDDKADLPIVEVIAAYCKYVRGYYAKGGKPTREASLVKEVLTGFVQPQYGRTLAIEFGPLALKAVREALITADHSRCFINKNIDRIRRMFRWAASEEMIPATVPQALATVSGLRRGRTEARETEPVRPVDDAVVEETLRHLPGAVADMVRFQRLTGCRPAEVCDVRPCDVDRSGDV